MKPSGATGVVVGDPAAMRALWRIREDGAGILTRSPDGGEAWPGWEDAAVPPERLGAYFGHFGDGCLHVRIDFDLFTRPGIDSGCCGLAGNFGFEKGHYEVSMACAERVLLPAVRAADPDVAVLADGFSCRTQLRQAGTREPVHLAQLAGRALGLV